MHSFHKAVYKPDSMSTDEFIIILGDVAAAEKWRGGDRYALLFPTSSLPLPDPPSHDAQQFFHLSCSSHRRHLDHPRTLSTLRSIRDQFLTSARSFRSAHSSIPLVEVVDSFDVFHTGQGSQGVLSRASKQELENIFSTTNEDEIVQIVLEKGRIVSSNTPHQWAGTNDQRSGSYQTAHGANAGKSGHGGR
ncbi:hypothetical protein NBRC10512_004222 [Rhodotorula toruloides]|uniref:RHTO0S25e01222g1_1 n=2 Tax=Rhodotorula toruloides TaxID=5286 RepID=A0A061BH47_RHOTO|nr:RNA binding protein [Rhodotorula toruloides NP11]EMS18822.1 RNA binding protein [Rhodotorula toruloides NP11]CDR49321.1 RHTO0S25e01222g1_1 [Rhodotorula toruloides]